MDWLETLRELVSLWEDDPCWADHHGRCQAHYLEPIEECRVAAAKELVEMMDELNNQEEANNG